MDEMELYPGLSLSDVLKYVSPSGGQEEEEDGEEEVVAIDVPTDILAIGSSLKFFAYHFQVEVSVHLYIVR